MFLLDGRLTPAPRSVSVFASTPLSVLKTKPRVEKAKQPRKKMPAIEKPRSDDLMLALGISVSEEVQRREEDGFISTQEYQEDESRREELLDEERRREERLEDERRREEQLEDERRREERLEDMRRKREELLARSRDMFGEEEEEEEEAEEEEQRQSQYFPWTMTEEGMEVLEEDRRKEEERKRNLEEAFGNDKDDTMKMRFCGDEETLMPESRSEHVGKRPKPSVITRMRYDTVAEENSPERVIYSFTRSPPPFER